MSPSCAAGIQPRARGWYAGHLRCRGRSHRRQVAWIFDSGNNALCRAGGRIARSLSLARW